MNSLVEEAISHRAINHPYLIALRDGTFKNMDKILHDFAHQYGFYSAWFPRYLTSVIASLEDPIHRKHLLDNLAEESGFLHEEDMSAIREQGIQDEWVVGIPHPLLFKRFQHAMGVNPESNPCIEVEIWRESFFILVKHGTTAEAIGAIGLGTESVVKHIYKHIIESLRNHSKLTLEEYVFFPLHTEVDDEHGLILLDIAKQFAEQDNQLKNELRKGMLKALNLRATFWDDMHARALKIDQE